MTEPKRGSVAPASYLESDPYGNPDFRRLKAGEFISAGDAVDRANAGNQWEIITEATVISGKAICGMMWLDCYPTVFRRVSR